MFKVRHGHTSGRKTSKTYQAYKGLINRCYRAKTKSFENYGGRGITVCERWRFGENGLTGFECFLADMGEAPADKSIDRIDNDGSYEPTNCRWSTQSDQCRNKRNNRWITAFGRTQLMEDWAREYSMDAAFLYNRLIRDGMAPEEALTRPRTRELTVDQVRDIHSLHQQPGVSQAATARQYGVSADLICKILKRKLWPNA